MIPLFRSRPAAFAALFCIAPLVGSGSAAFAQTQATPPAVAPAEPAAAIKQIVLTEKQVQAVLSAQKAMDALTDKLPDTGKPDARLQAQLDEVARTNGFADYADYATVVDNVSLVLSGIDPKTKSFTQPPELLKQQIAALQADSKMPAKDKQAALDDMNAALQVTPNVQHMENVALVTNYFDKLYAALQED
jgi:hypothetical protein